MTIVIFGMMIGAIYCAVGQFIIFPLHKQGITKRHTEWGRAYALYCTLYNVKAKHTGMKGHNECDIKIKERIMSDLYSTWIRVYGLTPGGNPYYECENCKATWLKERQGQQPPERCPRCDAKMKEK